MCSVLADRVLDGSFSGLTLTPALDVLAVENPRLIERNLSTAGGETICEIGAGHFLSPLSVSLCFCDQLTQESV